MTRLQWRRINLELDKVWTDPALKSYQTKIQAATLRGDLAEQSRLQAEQTVAVAEISAKMRGLLRADIVQPVDASLLDLQARLTGSTNKVERAAILNELAQKLGRVKFIGNNPASGADAYGATSGVASRHGLMIQLSWLSLNDATTSLPALSEWLCNSGCKGTRYDFVGSFPIAASGDSD